MNLDLGDQLELARRHHGVLVVVVAPTPDGFGSASTMFTKQFLAMGLNAEAMIGAEVVRTLRLAETGRM